MSDQERKPTPLTLEEVERRRRVRESKRRKSDAEKNAEIALRRKARRDRRAQAKAASRGKVEQANRISALWETCTDFDAFVVGTGTSLAGFDFTRLNDRKRTVVIGLNDAVKAPGFVPDFSLFCDVGIWTRYRDMDLHPKTRMVCQPRARKQFLKYEKCRYVDRVWHFNHVSVAKACDRYDDDLFVSRTVATGGIMMAYKLGARRVFLLGVDGYKLPSDKPGGTYYHDGSGKGKEGRKERMEGGGIIVQDRHDEWMKNMRALREWFDGIDEYQEEWRGRNVYNLSGRSPITTWQKLKIKTVLGPGCFPGCGGTG